MGLWSNAALSRLAVPPMVRSLTSPASVHVIPPRALYSDGSAPSGGWNGAWQFASLSAAPEFSSGFETGSLCLWGL